MWDGEYTVALKHLKSYEYLPAECEQMQEVCDRIHKLGNNENLEETARAMLRQLGELKRPYLTALEEKLLNVVEKEYEIVD